MSACTEVRDLLLDAETAELRGDGAGKVATHVRGCFGCSEQARRILEAQKALAAELATRAANVAPHADASAARQLGERRRRRGRRVVWGVAAPLAAALAGLALFQARGPANPGPPLGQMPEWALPTVGGTEGVSVVRESTGRVAVLATADPEITVVWLFK